jgi:elongation factor G
MANVDRLRNIAFVGPHHAGKTTLVEAILAKTGAIGRRGSVADGTTVTDHEPEDIAHVQSTGVGFAHFTIDGSDVTLADCPGFVDFFAETKALLRGVDAAIVVIEADPQRVVQAKATVDFLESLRLPHLFVVNKMDRPGADFNATLAALQDAYGRHVVAEQLPIGSAEHFQGYIDLAERKAWKFADGSETECAVPAELESDAAAARGQLLEAMADFDDHLMEELLEGVDPDAEEIERDLCDECAHDQIVPVVVASGATGAGVDALVRSILKWFPSPAVAEKFDAAGNPIAADPGGPIVAQIIKTAIHPQSGKVSIARIYSGTVKADATLSNTDKDGEKVRLGGLFRLQGKKQEPITEAGAGSIVAFARLETVSTGDTLTAPGVAIRMSPIAPADPVFAAAIKPKDRIDEAKISQMLQRIVDEDPALQLRRADVTHELLLLGAGEHHVSIAIERLGRKYKVEVESHPPSIPYLETITSGTEIHSRYKHQTGGHGQFGDVWLRFEPRHRGSGVTFEDKIVGGVVPRQFIPAVEKGVREALAHGPNGNPITDLHVTLFDGAYHDVDSSEQSFKTAAGMGVRDALPKCTPVVLEPIVAVEVEVPNTHTSAVIQQLTGKRGQILGMNPAERTGFDIVEAFVPQVELARYITELRTATQGLGTYRWRHERYDPVSNQRKESKAAV